MNDEGDHKKWRREALKTLREVRRETIEAASRRAKDQKRAIEAIKRELKAGGKTVPEISRAVGMPSSEVMWTIAALKKYGEIVEGQKEGSYFRYELAGGSEEEQSSIPQGRDAHGSNIS